MNKPEILEEWVAWCKTWDESSHAEKLEIAKSHRINYDTARHWRSDSGITWVKPPRQVKEAPAVEKCPTDEQLEAVREVLALKPKVDLDFVSFDIETTGLRADFSVVLSTVIKPFGQPPKIYRADEYPAWKAGHKADDRDICCDITNELSKHAIIVTHYGSGYDLPYTRAKLIRYGLPPIPPMFALDTYRIAKANMLVSRRRLEALAEYLKLGKKSAVEGNLWMEAAMNGDKKAMDAIVAHNVQDCELLERLASLLFPYLKSIVRL